MRGSIGLGAGLAALLVACGKDAAGPSGGADPCDVLGFTGQANAQFSATGAFTVSPIASSAISFIIPLGNLNPPNHVYPTDHMYIIPTNTASGANPVLAATGGTVKTLYKPAGTDSKVIVQVDKSFYYYYDHITPVAGLAEGNQVSAGQTLGSNSGLAAAIDFGVLNFNNQPLAGILNACAAQGQKYADSPLKYYSGATQQTLYGKVTVSGGATKDGKIDYDESGKLVGNWVLSGSNPLSSPDKGLAFAYNVLNHGLRISMGSSLSGGGAFAVQAGAADFNTVTQATGQVNYRLYPTGSGDSAPPGAEYGVLAVQVMSATRIKVQLFVGNLTGSGTFDSNALTYDR